MRLSHFPILMCLLVPAFGRLKIAIGPKQDSALISKEGRVVAALMWDARPMPADADTIVVSVGDAMEAPQAPLGENIPLSHPLVLETQSGDTLDLPHFRIRFYGNNDHYPLAYLHATQTPIHRTVSLHGLGIDSLKWLGQDSNYILLELGRIPHRCRFSLYAPNVMRGELNQVSAGSGSNETYFLHEMDTLRVGPGVHFPGLLIVNGVLESRGLSGDSVRLRAQMLSRPENTGRISAKFTHFDDLSSYGKKTSMRLDSCSGGTVGVIFGSMEINGGIFETVSINEGKAVISGSVISRSLYPSAALLYLRKSRVRGDISASCSFESAYFLKDNVIEGRMGSSAQCASPKKSLIVAEGNRFTAPNDINRPALTVPMAGYAWLRGNVFKGYWDAVAVNEGGTAVIHNNTFVNMWESGVLIAGNDVRIAVANNVFANSPLHYNVVGVESYASSPANTLKLGKNLWYTPGLPDHLHGLLRETGKTVVTGDRQGIKADPAFADTLEFRIKPESPAVDAGMTGISGFHFTVTVLDTSIAIPDSFTIDAYAGKAPDLGAHELGESTPVSGRFPGLPERPNGSARILEIGGRLHLTLGPALASEFAGGKLTLFGPKGEALHTRFLGEAQGSKAGAIELEIGSLLRGVYYLALRRGSRQTVVPGFYLGK